MVELLRLAVEIGRVGSGRGEPHAIQAVRSCNRYAVFLTCSISLSGSSLLISRFSRSPRPNPSRFPFFCDWSFWAYSRPAICLLRGRTPFLFRLSVTGHVESIEDGGSAFSVFCVPRSGFSVFSGFLVARIGVRTDATSASLPFRTPLSPNQHNNDFDESGALLNARKRPSSAFVRQCSAHLWLCYTIAHG